MTADYEYILLGYASAIIEQPAIPRVALAWRDTEPLRVHFVSEWLEDLPHAERDYVRELLKDWAGRSGEETRDLIRQLSDLSTGSFRLLSRGLCSMDEEENLLHTD